MVHQKELLSDPEVIEKQFPIFSEHPRLVYLDNAATTQRPKSVIDRINNFHQQENASIRRGAYRLASHATQEFKVGRSTVANFFGASSSDCIAFTSGTTESINVVSRSIISPKVKEGDNIVVTLMEHHANFIPWQMLCQEKNLELRVVPLNKWGELDMNKFEELIDYRTIVVAVTHISNTLGTINPISEVIQLAHRKQASVLIDAAQSATVYPIDVQKLDCDFLVCSAHKMFGPFGVGILYVHQRHHQLVNPYNYGGGIIRS
ncbi:MAG: aminotransferase class V-fold PLP-dependent enzyme, partial [Bacteroidota bacterium]